MRFCGSVHPAYWHGSGGGDAAISRVSTLGSVMAVTSNSPPNHSDDMAAGLVVVNVVVCAMRVSIRHRSLIKRHAQCGVRKIYLDDERVKAAARAARGPRIVSGDGDHNAGEGHVRRFNRAVNFRRGGVNTIHLSRAIQGEDNTGSARSTVHVAGKFLSRQVYRKGRESQGECHLDCAASKLSFQIRYEALTHL